MLIITTCPFELVLKGFLHLDASKQDFEYILVVMDNYTHFAQGYATKDETETVPQTVQTGSVMIKALNFGFLQRIHHDIGRQFENQLMTHLQKNCAV